MILLYKMFLMIIQPNEDILFFEKQPQFKRHFSKPLIQYQIPVSMFAQSSIES